VKSANPKSGAAAITNVRTKEHHISGTRDATAHWELAAASVEEGKERSREGSAVFEGNCSATGPQKVKRDLRRET